MSPSPVEVFLAGQGNPHTRRAFEQALVRAATVLFRSRPERCAVAALPWTELRYYDLERLKADLVRTGYSVSTINLTLAAVRGLLRHARRLRLLSPDDFDDIRDVRRAPGRSLPAGRALSVDEIGRLFAAARSLPSPLRERDGALLALAFTSAARRAEIASLDLCDLSTADAAVVVRAGKGGRPRVCHLTAPAVQHVSTWLRVRGHEPGPLLCPVRGRRVAQGTRLSASAIYRRFRVLSTGAGLPRACPHDARRSVATRMLSAGIDVNTVAEQTGHASLHVLRAYDRRPEAVVRRAVEQTLAIEDGRAGPEGFGTPGQGSDRP